jgi:hypothetical protein
VVTVSAGNRVGTSGSNIKHVELETLKYVSSGYGRYLPDFVLYSTHEPCCRSRSQARYGRLQVASLSHPLPARFREGPSPIPAIGGFLKQECQKLFRYRTARFGSIDIIFESTIFRSFLFLIELTFELHIIRWNSKYVRCKSDGPLANLVVPL